MQNDDKKNIFGRGKRATRLTKFTKNVAREWKSSVAGDNGKYYIKTSNRLFGLVIAQEDSSLCVTSCLYRCSSEHQSARVMKKALELNYLTRNRLGFTMAIEPASFKGHPKTVGLVDLTLCYCKSFVGMRFDRFRRELKDFVEVACNIQSQLQTIDDGRLGATPRNDGLIDSGIEALRRPESMVPMPSPLPPIRKPSPPSSPGASQPACSTSLKEDILAGNLPRRLQSLVQSSVTEKIAGNTKPSQPVRSHSVVTVSTKAFMKKKYRNNFDTPAEAKLYETFMRKKALKIQQAKELHNCRHEDEIEDIIFCDDSDDDSVVTIVGASASAMPKFGCLAPTRKCEDDGKTPIISNRKSSDEDFKIVESEHRAVC